MRDVVREPGAHEVAYYNWRKEHVGMKVGHQMKRLRELEQENGRLRKAVFDLTGQDDPSGSSQGKLLILSPERLRRCIDALRERLGVSERRACLVLSQH